MSTITYPPVKQALADLEALYADEELRMQAERREQALVDYEDRIDYALMKGREEGREEGRQEGRREAAFQALSTLITYKFGAVPEWGQVRLEQAGPDDIERWTVRVLDAQCIEDIFD